MRDPRLLEDIVVNVRNWNVISHAGSTLVSTPEVSPSSQLIFAVGWDISSCVIEAIKHVEITTLLSGPSLNKGFADAVHGVYASENL